MNNKYKIKQVIIDTTAIKSKCRDEIGYDGYKHTIAAKIYGLTNDDGQLLSLSSNIQIHMTVV